MIINKLTENQEKEIGEETKNTTNFLFVWFATQHKTITSKTD